MIGGVFAFAVCAEPVPGGGRVIAAPGPLIPNIRPNAGRGALLLRLHLDGRVVGEDGLSGPDMATNRVRQWFQQRRGSPHPIGQG